MESLKEDYIIRLYRPGDEDKIVALLKEVFGNWPRFDIECSPVEHWKWKFLDNPAYTKQLPHTVADYHSEIVCVSHGMLYNTKVGDTTYLAFKGVDAANQLKHRGKGLYSKCNRLTRSTVQEIMGPEYYFDFALTANPIFFGSNSNKDDSLFPQPLKYMVKIDNVDRYFKKLVKEKNPYKRAFLKLAVYGSKSLNKLVNIGVKPSQLSDITFKEITKFDKRIDAFNEKVKPNYTFLVEKTMKHMNWRYCDKRGGDFKVWQAEKDDEILGFLVLRINKIDPEYPEGYIMDLLTLNGREDVAEYFVKMAVDYMTGHGVGVMYAQVISGHQYEKLFIKYGLMDSRVKPHLSYLAINLGNDLERFANSPGVMLHYPYGEGDAI